MSDRLDEIWSAYQLGQVSADHTDKQVFREVVGAEIERLRFENEAHIKVNAAIGEERDALRAERDAMEKRMEWTVEDNAKKAMALDDVRARLGDLRQFTGDFTEEIAEAVDALQTALEQGGEK